LELAALAAPAGGLPGLASTSDTDVLTALFADPAHASLIEAVLAALPLVRGAYSLVFADERTLYAARDPQGFRPLVLGRLTRGSPRAGWSPARRRPWTSSAPGSSARWSRVS